MKCDMCNKEYKEGDMKATSNGLVLCPKCCADVRPSSLEKSLQPKRGGVK